MRANNIVNAGTPGFMPMEPVFSPIVNGGGAALFTQVVNGPVNLIAETIGLTMASQQYKAAANLIRTGEELSDSLFRALA